MITKAQKQILKSAHKHRERHANHHVGDELYFNCEFSDQYTKGVVYQVVPYACTYYILEVDVPGLGDSYLEMVSQYQVLVENEVDLDLNEQTTIIGLDMRSIYK